MLKQIFSIEPVLDECEASTLRQLTRAELQERKEKLSMEVLWIQQAIGSRKNVRNWNLELYYFYDFCYRCSIPKCAQSLSLFTVVIILFSAFKEVYNTLVWITCSVHISSDCQENFTLHCPALFKSLLMCPDHFQNVVAQISYLFYLVLHQFTVPYPTLPILSYPSPVSSYLPYSPI